MTGQQLLDNVYTVYRGKIASRTPAWGSDKANVMLNIANRKIQEWATDPRNKWNSQFEIRSVDTIALATKTYNLDADFFQASDFAKVVKTDDSEVEYPIIKAQQRGVLEGQSLYISGLNPKTITFAQDLDTGLDGGELFIAGYFIPASMTLAADVVPVDDPNWLVYIVASELARNDPAKDDQFSTLAGMANELYMRMSNANNDTGFLQMNSVVNNMPQVSVDFEDWSN